MSRPVKAAVLAVSLLVATAAPGVASPFAFPEIQRQGLGSAPEPPPVSAPSWILHDASSGATLASHNAGEMRAPASVTKIMTALLALEMGDQSDMVTISARAAGTGERSIGLWAGERVALGALLRAAMVHSANDAATAIAEHIGGSVEEFAVLMNRRARELGMIRTQFQNPHGLDANGHVTTAEDMLVLALAAMQRQDFREIVSARIVVFPLAPDGTTRRGTASNLLLDSYPGTSGIKTGFTNRAALTFVASAERDGRALFAVVLGSQGQRGHLVDARLLLDFGFERLHAYGALAGLPHRAPMPVTTPSHVEAAATLEALVHLAGAGLLDVEPDTDSEPVPPPVEVHRRHPEPSANDIWTAATFWIRSVFSR
jgi:serine-type D-Ala-D-Ala carboxypeptidase (penicillin-binding protein 5/6)